MIVNPILVTVFQLRLTRSTAHIPASLKLGLAMPMMGVPFLLLNWNGSAPVIALVIVIFVIGEMLWVPTSQAVVAALAPADIRGAYMGAVRRHLVGRLGADAVPRPAGARRLRRRGDVDVRRRVGVIAGITGLVAARGHEPSGSRNIARVKGLIAAGGKATRLEELTRVTNKHLLPVGRWPMVYYPLQLLQSAGVTDVLIVTGKQHAGQFIDLLGNGQVKPADR